MSEPLKVSYGRYDGNHIWFLTPDGSIIERTFEDLEYPYFYGDVDLSNEVGVIRCTPEHVNLLYKKEEVETDLYKIEVARPELVTRHKGKCKVVAEADIKYLERRLGADNIITWEAPEKVAVLDIEVDKHDNVFLTGFEIIENGKRSVYRYVFDLKDLVDYLEKHNIHFLAAYNGDNYDFLYIAEKLEGTPQFEYLTKCLFIDIAPLYNKLMHKAPAPLSQVAVNEGLMEKLEINYLEEMDTEHIDKVIPYTERDVGILSRLIIKHHLIDAIYIAAKETGVMPFGREGLEISQVPEVENYIIKNRKEFGYWLTPKETGVEEKVEGGEVVSPPIGIYENVAVVDYTSLYPNSVIHSRYDGEGKHLFELFKKILKDFTNKKKIYKKLKSELSSNDPQKVIYDLLYDVYKILANGSYGVFATIYFRYYLPSIANFITETGRKKRGELDKIMKKKIQKDKLYGDTDSSFNQIETYEKALQIVDEVNAEIAPYEVSLDYFFTRIVFFAGANSGEVKKRYAGINREGKIIIKGLEAIRKDWCSFIKETQKKAIDIMLKYPMEEIKINIVELIQERRKMLEEKTVPLEELLITKSVKMNKDYKAKQSHVQAYEKLIAETGETNKVVPFVSYWIIAREVMGKRKIKKVKDVLPLGSEKVKDELSLLDWKYYIDSHENLIRRIITTVEGF